MLVDRRLLSPLFALAFGLGCRGSVPAAAEPVIDPEVAAARDREPDTFTLLQGTWDFAHGDTTCKGNRHEITFSPDRQEMFLTFQTPFDTATGERVTRYKVVARGRDVHPHIPHILRTAMEGETRRTASGELVLWDILLVTPNRYHWHRTDWAPGGVTRPIIRCDGDRPLEESKPGGDR